ncbi:hypothetical protein Tco_1249703, partial [Tanacetum coccineum]
LMEISIADQIALDDALVAPADRLKIEKKSGKGKQKTTELETISEADLTEAEQLKIITKRSRQETHSSHTSGSGADEGTGVTPGVPDAPDYDSEDDISWKSSDDDQDDDQAQDDEDADKNNVNETIQDDEDDDDHDDDEKAQDDEDDDDHDDDKKVQDDDDEEQTESNDDGDDFVHPKLTTHDDDIIHEEETNEDDSFDPTIHTSPTQSKVVCKATYEEDQGNEAVEDTNTDLDGRDDVMTDVILPQVQATQEIEDTHVTLTPVNPDGQQQSSSVSSGFVRHSKAYKALVDAYEADKILLDTYGDTVIIKRPRDGADDDQEPSAGIDWGSKRRRSGKEPASTSALREMTTTTAGKTTIGSKTHKQSASQSTLVEETMQSTDVFKAPAH